jgi:mitochondrial fission protein ELM1
MAMFAHRAADVPEVARHRSIVPPLVWVLEDDKLGHTMQSVALAEALGWPYTRTALSFNAVNRLSNRVLGASVLSLDRRRSTPLSPPWPDLVIATGRRSAPSAPATSICR